MPRIHRRLPPKPIDFLPGEEWLELPHSPQRYLASTHGRCYTLVRRRLLVPQWIAGSGKRPALYWRLGPRDARQMVSCSHWVLMLFGPPRPTLFHVATHLDGDRANLHVQNLEWRPRQGAEHMRSLAARANDVRWQ